MSTVSPISQTATAAYGRVQAQSDHHKETHRDKTRADVKDSSARANHGPATRVTLSPTAHAVISSERASHAYDSAKETGVTFGVNG